jgi:hypothetical protein
VTQDLDRETPLPAGCPIGIGIIGNSFALLATGKNYDVWYDITVSQPTELRLGRFVYGFDDDYEKITSFLGLYERGGGPGGDGGGDNTPRIQVYIYDLYSAGGQVSPFAGSRGFMFIDIGAVSGGSTFTHELCHLIYWGNYFDNLTPDERQVYFDYPPPDQWPRYGEFLPCMAEVVFYDLDFSGSPMMSNIKLFEVLEGHYDGLFDYTPYYILSQFLVEKYGNSILYDLFYELPKGVVGKEALENVLRKRGSTISAMEAEFAVWCDNRGTQS